MNMCFREDLLHICVWYPPQIGLTARASKSRFPPPQVFNSTRSTYSTDNVEPPVRLDPFRNPQRSTERPVYCRENMEVSREWILAYKRDLSCTLLTSLMRQTTAIPQSCL